VRGKNGGGAEVGRSGKAQRVPTTLEKELQEQRRWRLRPEYAGGADPGLLVASEFRPAAERAERVDRALAGMVRFCARNVPHYARVCAELGLDVEEVGLGDLPPLTRAVLRDAPEALRSAVLPPGHKLGGTATTTGTTGEPVVVVQTAWTQRMFFLIKQREMRWFRFDPMGLIAWIRPRRDLGVVPGASGVEKGGTVAWRCWPGLGRGFETGPFIGFEAGVEIEGQLAWLEAQRPDYLVTQSANLEHLAFARQGIGPFPGLRGALAISQTLTPGMKRRVEETLGIGVHQNYGLNELGIVASKCVEGDRYHVHSEHAHVELVGADGRPAAPGEFGRILVSTVNNFAMPLLRYDADDFARVLDGPCPCGRTLPSFGEVVGRYRRIAFLPPGVWNCWTRINRVVEGMPRELTRELRQYQLQHFRDGRFLLRIAAAGALPDGFFAVLRGAWEEGREGAAPELEIALLDRIPHEAGTKFQNFVSECVPGPDEELPPGVNPLAEA
jgi:phenylacetate-CoA ligase